MRLSLVLLALILTTGCSAFIASGGGAYQAGKDERSSAVVSADSGITTEIRSKFAADPLLRDTGIGVRTYEGTVTLTGTVANPASRDQAGRIAQSARGALMVNNQIVVDD